MAGIIAGWHPHSAREKTHLFQMQKQTCVESDFSSGNKTPRAAKHRLLGFTGWAAQ
jgi:hypothetical protein